MMQDYPKLLDASARVGFSEFQRWTSFSAVKNALADGVQKQKDGNAPESAASGEHDLYLWTQRVFTEAGVDVPPPAPKSFRGLEVQSGAKIVLHPSFGVTQKEIRDRVSGESGAVAAVKRLVQGKAVRVGGEATVVLAGDVVVHAMNVTGAVEIRAGKGARVVVDGLTVPGGRWALEELKEDGGVEQKYAVRGYTLNKVGGEVYAFEQPGEYVLSDESKGQYKKAA